MNIDEYMNTYTSVHTFIYIYLNINANMYKLAFPFEEQKILHREEKLGRKNDRDMTREVYICLCIYNIEEICGCIFIYVYLLMYMSICI
jgi:hypothetical protein